MTINQYVNSTYIEERADDQSVLAGLTPSVILEIASRSAWCPPTVIRADSKGNGVLDIPD
jgi:hypothetical protein